MSDESNVQDNLFKALWGGASSAPHRRRPRRKRKDLEAGVLRECLDWLAKHPAVVYVERRNTGAFHLSDGGYIRFGAPGTADIWCLVRGARVFLAETMRGWYEWIDPILHVEIEVKRRDGKGKLSAAQKKFQAYCKEIGVPYFVVTSKEALAAALSTLTD